MCQLRAGMRVVGSAPAVRLLPLDPDPALPALRDRGRAGRRQGPGRLGAARSRPGTDLVSSKARATRRSSWSTSPRSRELAHGAGAKVIVDNVFATPLLQQPLELGADLVVYSATKHIDGQGRVPGRADLQRPSFTTGRAAPLSAQYRAGRSARSTPGCCSRASRPSTLRVRAQSDAAARLAAGWRRIPQVERVLYPGLAAIPQHDLARRQMQAAATLVAFASAATAPRRSRVLNRLRADQDLQQSRRRQVADHPSGEHHALEDRAAPSACRGHHRGHAAPLGRAGGRRGPDRRPRPGAGGRCILVACRAQRGQARMARSVNRIVLDGRSADAGRPSVARCSSSAVPISSIRPAPATGWSLQPDRVVEDHGGIWLPAGRSARALGDAAASRCVGVGLEQLVRFAQGLRGGDRPTCRQNGRAADAGPDQAAQAAWSRPGSSPAARIADPGITRQRT